MKFTGLFNPWQTYILNEAVNTCTSEGEALEEPIDGR